MYRVRSKGAAVALRDCPQNGTNEDRKGKPVYVVGPEWAGFDNAPLPDSNLDIEEGEAPRAPLYVAPSQIERVGMGTTLEKSADGGSFIGRTASKLKKALKEDEDNKTRGSRRSRKPKPEPSED